MKYQWNAFDDLTTAEQLAAYLDGQVYRHGSYCHYTRLEFIESILAHNTFQLSCVAGFNDKIDAQQFGEARRFYSLCFSTGVNENLSLWYLYSGMQGQGGRIRFTAHSVKKLLETSTFELFEYPMDDRNAAKPRCALNPGDYTATFHDVLYAQEKPNKVSLKYNTMTNYLVSPQELAQFKAQRPGFTKSIVWYYEKETRFLLELSDSIVAQMRPDMNYYVAMHFPDSVKSMLFVGFAPEITSMETEIASYPSIAALAARKRELSEYSGTVKMRLCEQCGYYQRVRKCQEMGCEELQKV